MNNNKYLPIGTVILLKNATKTIMITGYLQKEVGKNEKFYDYVGCLYPEGYIAANKNLLFDHVQIDKVLFKGYETEEQKDFFKQIEVAKLEIDKKLLDNQGNDEIEML